LPRSPVLGLRLEDTSVMRDAAARARTIPVVFNSVSDPIGYGLVASIARPGAISLAFSSTRKALRQMVGDALGNCAASDARRLNCLRQKWPL
jgi:hypothetical protein